MDDNNIGPSLGRIWQVQLSLAVTISIKFVAVAS